ncbi:hypothetical protein ACJMK2_020462 [Sinanodonta woodiana]|uniref:Alpha-1,3-mannosyl-glycoprotein 4-beta-N-acetylglucosaminyltransferase C n=1 Tax=Sinanodonta woodiana TaxID=1069815 RepID=A0ABD3U089_SINWO
MRFKRLHVYVISLIITGCIVINVVIIDKHTDGTEMEKDRVATLYDRKGHHLRQIRLLQERETTVGPESDQPPHGVQQNKISDTLVRNEKPSIEHRIDVIPEQALLRGKLRKLKSYLTIGIPSVKRQGDMVYLYDTVNSLLRASSDAEKNDFVIVIYLAQQDQEWIQEVLLKIDELFPTEIESGVIQVISSSAKIYYDFTYLIRTFNDSAERVHWRTKQNLDYAFLFKYCENLSTYYINIEDDVIPAKGFFNSIKSFIGRQSVDWFCLDFSSIGFIGKLFHSSDLDLISHYLILFSYFQPADNLIDYMKKITTQFKDIRHKPSLFQHRGVVSSLRDKKQLIIDKSFKDQIAVSQKKYVIENPKASIETDMIAYDHYVPNSPYLVGNDLFWAYNITKGNYYKIIFEKPVNLTKIYINTGHEKKPHDILHHGEVKIGTSDLKCNRTESVADFHEKFTLDESIPNNITCLVIEVKEDQKEWLIIREIALFH